MEILSIIHGETVRAGVFGDVVSGRGHSLEEWSFAWDTPIPKPLDEYGAVLVFGGAMHADQERHHPWLRDETFFLERLLDLHTPVLGICLGAQLLARAAHADVYPASEPEVGWHRVELTGDAEGDPVLGGLPRSFEAFQWHYYAHSVPAGAVELAHSEVCTQAFRLGDCAWGLQFHPEVTLAQVEGWLDEDDDEPIPIEPAVLLAETQGRIEGWNSFGRDLCAAFLTAAERVAAAA